MCWGSALECLDLVTERVSPPAALTILGAGIIGLTSALVLSRAGYSIRLKAREFPPHTTSDIAGGLWAPACVACGEPELYARVVRRSREFFESHAHPMVYPCPLYVTDPESELNQSMGQGEPIEGGQSWPTLLVETASYLPWLLEQVRLTGASIEQGVVQDLSTLPGHLVNCLGIGAGPLTGDDLLVPVRGQLVYAPATAEPFAWEHPQGYLIGRKDRLVLGGTEEEGVGEAVPVPEDCQAILERHRGWVTRHRGPVTNLSQLFNNLAT